MNPNDIIQQYGLHEAKESGRFALPETIPSGLINMTRLDRKERAMFENHHEVKAYTNDSHTVWLLVSKAEHRFLLQAPI
jgi:hypothetical protein